MEGRGLCPGFCHPCGQSQASASQSQGTLPLRWSAELAPSPGGGSCSVGAPGQGTAAFVGSRGCRQPAGRSPLAPGALELVLCGDRPRGDAQCWLCPTANAQQGLALRSRGGARGRTHVGVGTSGARTHVPGHPEEMRVGTPQHPLVAGCCCLPQRLARTGNPCSTLA